MSDKEKHFGEVVIYEKPLTREKPEGAARLVKKLGSEKVENGLLERWKVRFWNEEWKEWEAMTYERSVLVDDPDEKVYDSLPEGEEMHFIQHKYCRCAICGQVARSTPARDYFLIKGDPLRRLKCESCLMSNRQLAQQGELPIW